MVLESSCMLLLHIVVYFHTNSELQKFAKLQFVIVPMGVMYIFDSKNLLVSWQFNMMQ